MRADARTIVESGMRRRQASLGGSDQIGLGPSCSVLTPCRRLGGVLGELRWVPLGLLAGAGGASILLSKLTGDLAAFASENYDLWPELLVCATSSPRRA